MHLKETYVEQKQNYLECKYVERALLRHVQDAVEEKCIEALIDDYTNLIAADTPTILQYLFTNYGKVTSDEVADKDAEVMALAWHPADPLVLLTKPIENLHKLAAQANMTFTEKRILEKGLQLIRKTRDFKAAQTTWSNLPQAQQKWDNFKSHFHNAQLHLKEIQGPTMQQSSFHHANILAEKIQISINNQAEQRDQQLTELTRNVINQARHAQNQCQQQEPPQHSANAASQDHVQLETLKILK